MSEQQVILSTEDLPNEVQTEGEEFQTEEFLIEDAGEGTIQIPSSLNRQTGSAGTEVPWIWIFSVAGALLFLAIVAAVLSVYRKRKSLKPQETFGEGQSESPDSEYLDSEEDSGKTEQIPSVSGMEADGKKMTGMIGKVHNIGKRKNQQDCYGFTSYDKGILAVVADGMGGLSDGDKVSRRIVDTMLGDVEYLTGRNTNDMLFRMLAHTNQEINRMLGVSDQFRSGSTLIAVLVEENTLQWISVGDSRIYLFRAGQLLQLNREHAYEAELLCKAVNCEINFDEVGSNPHRKGLSSFLGMGKLKYIDGSIRPAAIQHGDRILLMTDGVFNTLSEQEICRILSQNKDAVQAASVLEESVLARQNPRQDNFTALLLNI